MSAMVESGGRAHTPATLGATGDSQDPVDRASSGVNYATSPEVSNLQKVTELLKERLTSRRDEDNNERDGSKSPMMDNYGQMERDYISGNSHPENGVHDLTNMVSRHAISMMRNEPLASTENSKVLRGVLQSAGENNNTESSGPDSQDNSMVGKLLRERDSSLMRNNSYEIDVDGDSMPSINTPCDFSSEDLSDNENNFTSNNSPSAAFLAEDEEFNEEFNNSGSSGESNEVKRARVETIISGMNGTSPSKENIVPPIDQRRHKRKQYIPQQHDSSRLLGDEPEAKMRKLEQDDLHNQLRQMQEQLASMQQRYTDLFEHQAANGTIDLAEAERRCQQRQAIINGMQEKENKIHELSKRHGLLGPMEIDSSPFIREARKLVNERIDSIKPQFSPLTGDTPKDFQHLARMLKSEITHSVGTLVDTVVARFVENQKQKELVKPQQLPSKPRDSPVLTSPVKEKQPMPTPPPELTKTPSTPEISHSIQKITNNNNEIKPINITPKPDEPHQNGPQFPQHSPDKHSPRMEPRMEMPKINRAKITDKIIHPFFDHPKPAFAELLRHAPLFPPPPYFHPTQMPHPLPIFPHPQPKINEPEPEQTEALALVVNTPKKKRTKVTDTRLSPRAARALLQEPVPAQHVHGENPDLPTSHAAMFNGERLPPHPPHISQAGMHPPLLPSSLPTSVAIPNPSLQHSDILAAMYQGSHPHMGGPEQHHPFPDFSQRIPTSRSPSVRDHGSPSMPPMNGPPDFGMFREQDMFNDGDCGTNVDGYPMTSTLTPMHLRKAKLMFFFVRYPSSSIIKIFFPDVKFNKNNTAQLVKWFSNFREFFYIQMEKYARQAIAEGVKNPEDLIVTTDSELYRVLNLHYNRNNQLEVPENFRIVVQATLREFYKSISAGKDVEQSWKKAIYKIIARMDDSIPEFFKSPNWMEQLNDN